MNILFKIKSLFVIITISFLFGFSCKKEPQEFDLSPEIKALWDFKPGTYWVYQDSISGKTDSVYVFNYSQRYDYYRGNRNFTGKGAEFEVISYNLNLFNDSIGCAIWFSNTLFNLDEAYYQRNTKDSTNKRMFYYIKKAGDLTDLIEVCNQITSEYSNYSFHTPVNLNLLNKYCVKPHIGINRYEFKDGRVYKLIRQHIVQ